MKFELTPNQISALEDLSRHSLKPHMRIKALALLNHASGRSQAEVAEIFRVHRNTVAEWRRRFCREGVAGLEMQSGRGRPSPIDVDQVASYVQQSPRNFGIDRTRWTLELLAKAVPCLNGYSRFGVQCALKRAGFSYKRGQPALHSPDPNYDEKKGSWTRR